MHPQLVLWLVRSRHKGTANITRSSRGLQVHTTKACLLSLLSVEYLAQPRGHTTFNRPNISPHFGGGIVLLTGSPPLRISHGAGCLRSAVPLNYPKLIPT